MPTQRGDLVALSSITAADAGNLTGQEADVRIACNDCLWASNPRAGTSDINELCLRSFWFRHVTHDCGPLAGPAHGVRRFNGTARTLAGSGGQPS